VHKKLIEVENDPAWKSYEEKGDFAGYTKPGEDGFLSIKSTGIVPCTPIEVQKSINNRQ